MAYLPISSTVHQSTPQSPTTVVTDMFEHLQTNTANTDDHAKKTSTKSVSFHPLIQCREVDYLKSCQLWWSIEELAVIKQECRYFVFWMNQISPSQDLSSDQVSFDEEEYCFRGLEGKMKHASSQRRFYQVQAQLGVLEEQEDQIQNKIRNDEQIAEIYHQLGKAPAMEALLRALQDQMTAQQHHMVTDDAAVVLSESTAKPMDSSCSSARSVPAAQIWQATCEQHKVAGIAA